MHFVPVKSVTQQAQGMVLKVRETLIGQRTRSTNTVRGHAAEFGVIAGKGVGQIGPLLLQLNKDAIPPEAREMVALLGRQIEALDARIKELDVKLAAAHKANEVSQRLATIPGVGPVTALTLASRSIRRRLNRSSSGRLGRADAEGTFDRRQAADGRHQPGRQ